MGNDIDATQDARRKPATPQRAAVASVVDQAYARQTWRGHVRRARRDIDKQIKNVNYFSSYKFVCIYSFS